MTIFLTKFRGIRENGRVYLVLWRKSTRDEEFFNTGCVLVCFIFRASLNFHAHGLVCWLDRQLGGFANVRNKRVPVMPRASRRSGQITLRGKRLPRVAESMTRRARYDPEESINVYSYRAL